MKFCPVWEYMQKNAKKRVKQLIDFIKQFKAKTRFFYVSLTPYLA